MNRKGVIQVEFGVGSFKDDSFVVSIKMKDDKSLDQRVINLKLAIDISSYEASDFAVEREMVARFINSINKVDEEGPCAGKLVLGFRDQEGNPIGINSNEDNPIIEGEILSDSCHLKIEFHSSLIKSTVNWEALYLVLQIISTTASLYCFYMAYRK